GADAKRALRAASVFGETFWRGGVAALVARSTSDVDAWLADLVEHEVVERRAGASLAGESELSFRHALVRDAAYAMVVDRDRTNAHKLAAEWLTGVGSRDPIALARHWELGGEPARAAASYARAADDALDAADLV